MKPPGQFTPNWLPRQQRRKVEHQLRKLFRSDNCSLCGNPFRHNSRTMSGLDTQGNVVLAGECCAQHVAVTFGYGLFSERQYDFLWRRNAKPTAESEPTNEQIVNAIAAQQEVIASTDKQFDGIERRGGVPRPINVSVLDHPWTNDDRQWFKQSSGRSHRMRPPFPGELDGVKLPAGRKVVVLVRQIEPGKRVRAVFDPDVILLPGSTMDEACAHACFEIAVGHEPRPADVQELDALIQKYAMSSRPNQ
jgi:hypothetical protein